ncbi:MAG: hypothetical protein LAP86_25825 [Acidobacteriia bacterium]|nr:hypothetical protein [Terriglobia bacterium]
MRTLQIAMSQNPLATGLSVETKKHLWGWTDSDGRELDWMYWVERALWPVVDGRGQIIYVTPPKSRWYH